jgi:TRF2-interacting telomeric protein/Rap1 - C terminal domain
MQIDMELEAEDIPINAEPETQDMEFVATQLPILRTRESTIYDISPSQQLQLESDQLQPVPFSMEQEWLRSKSIAHPSSSASLLTSGRNWGPVEQKTQSRSRRGLSPTEDGQRDDSEHLKEPILVASKRKLPLSFGPANARATGSRKTTSPKPIQKSKASGAETARSRDQPAPPVDDETIKENMQAIEECMQNFEIHYPRKVVLTGMACTTMNPGLAGVVMQSETEGKGIPQNIRGIWTEEDDDRLNYIDSVDTTKKPTTLKDKHLQEAAKDDFKALAKKHGVEGMEDRRRFLSDMEKLGIDWRRLRLGMGL